MLRNALKRWLPPRYLIHPRALDYYFFGAPEIRFIKRLCSVNKASVDIGANLGIFSYFMRRHSSHVFAYEPNPDLVALLNSTFRSGVTVVPTALSSEPGQLQMKIPIFSNVEQHGLASLSQEFPDADDVRTLDVPVRRLDDEPLGEVGFIKIDVEQHEREVLQGGMGLIAEQKPNLLVEVSPLLYETALPQVFEPILSLGYKGCFLFESRVVTFESFDPEIHTRRENLGDKHRFVGNVMLTPEHFSFT